MFNCEIFDEIQSRTKCGANFYQVMKELKIIQMITKRDSLSLDMYLNEIGKFELLTIEEEVILAQKIKDGDQSAHYKLVTCNLRFVVSVAKQYQHRGMDLIDLINEGNLGLIRAARRFDETKGFKFISFAVWWIRQSILQAIGDQTRVIRLPLSQVGIITKLNKLTATLEQELERMPSAEELSENTGIDLHRVAEYLNNARLSSSLDAVTDPDMGICLLDVLQDTRYAADNQVKTEMMQDTVREMLLVLSPRERYILTLNFGLGNIEPVLLEDIALELGIGRERVRQIKDKAIKKLKLQKKDLKKGF